MILPTFDGMQRRGQKAESRRGTEAVTNSWQWRRPGARAGTKVRGVWRLSPPSCKCISILASEMVANLPPNHAVANGQYGWQIGKTKKVSKNGIPMRSPSPIPYPNVVVGESSFTVGANAKPPPFWGRWLR